MNNFHQEVWEMETAGLASDLAWLKWLGKVEDLLGLKSLDGDEFEDGYSLDGAFDAYRGGMTPEVYASEVGSIRQQKKNADHVDGYDRDDLGESPDY